MAKTYSVIFTCSCYGMEKKAREAFSLLFPDKVIPDVVKGRDRLHKLGKELGNDHILAISKLSGKYAYYVKLKDNTVIEEWNLMTMKRVA